MDIIFLMKPILPNDLISRVKAAMEMRGYTSIMSLAKDAGVGESFIRSAEKSGSYLSTPTLIALSRTLRIPMGYFFGEMSLDECVEPSPPAFGERIPVVLGVSAQYVGEGRQAVHIEFETEIGGQGFLLTDAMAALTLRRVESAFRDYEGAGSASPDEKQSGLL